MITTSHLAELVADGWQISRDGSTATASMFWDDPDDADSGWEIHVKHTDGHGARLSITEHGLGLTERLPADADHFARSLTRAMELVYHWNGAPPEGVSR